MTLDQRLVNAAIDQLDRRWPTGQRVAAALLLEDGRNLTSVVLDNLNGGVSLRAETGAICQAYTEGAVVVASACVSRESDGERPVVLAPCGVCQERLALWGPGVQVAVGEAGRSGAWHAKTLREVQPHPWAERFADGDGPWPSTAMHTEV